MGNIYSQHQLLYGTRTNCTTAARRGALRSSDSSVRILRLSEQKPGSRQSDDGQRAETRRF